MLQAIFLQQQREEQIISAIIHMEGKYLSGFRIIL
jgi:hypothetical protein